MLLSLQSQGLANDTPVVWKLDLDLNHSLAVHRHKISIIVVTQNEHTGVEIVPVLKIGDNQSFDHVGHS